MKKLATIQFALIFAFLFSMQVHSQVSGDYGCYTGTSAGWGTASTWKVYNGTSWATSPAASSAPTASTNCWIVGGTITGLSSGTANVCANLTISSGTLTFSGGNPRYITVSGNFSMTGGTVGMSGNNAYYFIFSGSTATISISGGTWSQATTGTSTEQGLRYSGSGTGTLTSSIGVGTINVTSGTLKLGGNIAGATSTSASSYNLQVASGATFNPNGYTLTPSGNKNMSITGTVQVDKTNFTDTYVSFTTKTLNTGSTVSYTGASQNVDNSLSYKNLTINQSSGNATLSGGAGTVTNTLTLTSGKLILGANDLTISSSGSISGASATNYVVTSGAGSLKMQVATSGTTTFPVGPSTTLYNPLILTNSASGTTDTYGVVVASGTPSNILDANLTVNDTWTVTEGTGGGSDLTVKTQWAGTDEASSFPASRSSAKIGRWTGSAWDSKSTTIAGTDPYTAQASGFTGVGAFATAIFDITPNVTLADNSNGQQGAAAPAQLSSNNIIANFTLAPTASSATLNALTVPNSGTYTTGDLTALKLWYAATNNFGSASVIGTISNPTNSNPQTFSSLSQTVSKDATGYFWITADVGLAALGNTITVGGLSSSNFTFSVTVNFSGTSSAAGTQTVSAGSSTVTLSAISTIAAGNIAKGSTSTASGPNVLLNFQLAMGVTTYSLTQLNLSSTFTSGDFTNLKLWYYTSNTPASASVIGTISSPTTGIQSFSGLSQSISAGATGYFWVTADVSASAIVANTITANGLSSTDVTLTSSPTVNGSVAAGGTKTIALLSYRTAASGNWDVAGSWTTSYDLSSWSAASVKPGQANPVYIQSGHTITLTQNESCSDLHIANSTTSALGTSGTVALATNKLSVYGKWRTYYAAVGTIPGTSATNGYSTYPFTGSAGCKVSIAGTSRNLTSTGEWSATITTPSTGYFPVSIDVASSETVTLGTSIKVSSMYVTSGTLDCSANRLAPDSTNTVGVGDVYILSGATMRSAQSGTGSGSQIISRTGTSRCGTLTIASGGKLSISGSTSCIDVNSIVNNGTVEYTKSGSQTLTNKSGQDASAVAFTTYNNLTLSGTNTKTTPASLGITVNGVLSVEGSASLALGASGTLAYGASATLQYAGTTASTTPGAELTGSTTPNAVPNLIINKPAGGTVTLASGTSVGTATTVTTGALILSAALTCPSITVNDSLQLNTGGSVSSTPTYGASASLVYAGATIGGGNEAPSTSVTVPVINITSSTTLSGDITATTVNIPSGTLTVSSSHTLNGDINISNTGYLSVSTTGSTVLTTNGNISVSGASAALRFQSGSASITGVAGKTITVSNGGTLQVSKNIPDQNFANMTWNIDNSSALTTFVYKSSAVSDNLVPPTGVTSFGNLQFSSSSGAEAKKFNIGANYSIVGDLAFNDANTANTGDGTTSWDLGSYTISTSGTSKGVTCSTAAANCPVYIYSAATTPFSGFSTYNFVPTGTLAANSSFIYNGTTQNVITGAYQGLTIANSGTKSLQGTTSAVNLNLSAGTLDLGANSLTVSGAVSNTSGVLASSGSSTLTLSGSAPGHLPSGTLYNLSNSGSGAVTLDGALTCNGTLTIGASAGLNADASNAGLVHTLNGNWVNNSASGFDAGQSKFVMAGTSAQTMHGSTWYDLEINNPAGVTLETDETVNHSLILTSGLLTLGANNLILGASATVSGTPSASNMVVATGSGSMRKVFSDNGSFTFPVGDNDGTAEYSPVDFTLASNGGLSSAYVGCKLSNSKHSGITGGSYINRYWTLTANGITSPSWSGHFHYVSADVVGSAQLYGGEYTGSIGAWIGLGIVDTTGGTGLNIVYADPMTSTISSSGNDFSAMNIEALPVELSALTSNISGRNVQLDWTTATEINSYKFIVERSKAGSGTWSALGEVRANNYSNSPKNYSYLDKNLKVGKYVYRLKMVDNDGTFEYSKINTEATIAVPTEFSLSQNYPNPFNPTTKITYAVPSDSHVQLDLYSISGQKIATLVSENAEAGYYDLPVNMSQYGLASGMYIYHFSGKELNSGKQFTSVKKMMLLK